MPTILFTMLDADLVDADPCSLSLQDSALK
jgi:hypothetical protein